MFKGALEVTHFKKSDSSDLFNTNVEEGICFALQSFFVCGIERWAFLF